MFRLALASTPLHIRWLLGNLSPGTKPPRHEGDQSPPSSAVRMSEAVASPPHMPSWHTEGQLHLYLNAEFITLSLSVAINLNYITKQVTLIVTILLHWMLLSPDNDNNK
jgi:hypothetical protein